MYYVCIIISMCTVINSRIKPRLEISHYQFRVFLRHGSGLEYLFPASPLVVSPLSLFTLAGHFSLNSDSVIVVPKYFDICIIISSARFPWTAKVLFKWVLAKSLGKNQFHALLKQEFWCFNSWIHTDRRSFKSAIRQTFDFWHSVWNF